MKFDCCGYILYDGVDNLEIPCPHDSQGEFKKKPSFFRCRKCWKTTIDYENKIKKDHASLIGNLTRFEFINLHCSSWGESPWGSYFLIPYNSKGEPFEAKYLDWYYKTYFPSKYEERIKARREKRQAIIQETKNKKQRARNFIDQAKAQTAIKKLFGR